MSEPHFHLQETAGRMLAPSISLLSNEQSENDELFVINLSIKNTCLKRNKINIS